MAVTTPNLKTFLLAEALDSDLSYTTGGEGNFTKWSDPFYYDGDAAESIAVSDSEEAWLQTTVNANSGDKISFYWKVSSEQNGDYLEFYIDGGNYQDRISGDVDWQKKTYTLSSGSHTLKWRFIRNGDTDGGKDCGWVDFVQWTQASPVQDPNNWSNITYKYDPGGRRIEKNVDGYKTRYVYDGGNVIAEYDGNNNLTRKYIHGARIDELVCMIDAADSNAVYYYHYDGSGSVVALSDSSGDSCQSYEYSAYGQVAASDPNFITNPYMFTGRRFDYETGLYYYRARYYNPYIGRFLQTDPVGYGDGINWYAYCGNNPLNRVDPSGCNYVPWFTQRFLGTERWEAWNDVRGYAEDLLSSEDIDDVEALAEISDEVAEWTEEWYDSDDAETFMFVNGLANILCREVMGVYGPMDNPDQIGPYGDPNGAFGDTGFHPDYQEDGANQVDHFVAYLQAGYYLGYDGGLGLLTWNERWEFNPPDMLLGERGVWVGALMRYNHATWPASELAIKPNEVGLWILDHLAN